jgi:hypothetical protein
MDTCTTWNVERQTPIIRTVAPIYHINPDGRCSEFSRIKPLMKNQGVRIKRVITPAAVTAADLINSENGCSLPPNQLMDSIVVDLRISIPGSIVKLNPVENHWLTERRFRTDENRYCDDKSAIIMRHTFIQGRIGLVFSFISHSVFG